MRVCLSSLGCKLNQAEIDRLARRLLDAGHHVVESPGDADLHVINSCSVTHLAARDSRKLARRGRRINPALKTVLTGCYSESDREEAATLAGVDLIVSNRDKEHLLSAVAKAFPRLWAAEEGSREAPRSLPRNGHSRALVKIEDGCGMQCSFCIIPRTRGPQRSKRPVEVTAEVVDLVAAGYREVVLTGVQISSYRSPEGGLFELVDRLLRETEVPRLRLTSIAPWQFDPRLLCLFDGSPDRASRPTHRICRHFHLSLQSGCHATLRRMRRPYQPDQFARLVERIRARVPGAAITTDLIVGFPGEDEEEFEESLAFTREMAFARVHAFPFSARVGTSAADMPGQVPFALKRERMARALEVAAAADLAYRQRSLGSTVEVLWEEQRGRRWQGTSDNYLKVEAESDADLRGTLTTVSLFSLDGALSGFPTPGTVRGSMLPETTTRSLQPGPGARR